MSRYPRVSGVLAATRFTVTSGTTTLEPMGSSVHVVKPQATHANSQSVGGLPLDQSATTASVHAPSPYT